MSVFWDDALHAQLNPTTLDGGREEPCFFEGLAACGEDFGGVSCGQLEVFASGSTGAVAIDNLVEIGDCIALHEDTN